MRAHPPAIAVLGTLTRDTTVYADGSRSENLGGTHYSVLTLAHLFQGRARILPVAHVGADAFAAIDSALTLPGVDRSGLRQVPQPNNHVYLTYTSATEREEILVGLVPPLTAAECAGLGALDWILVNLTSGRDVTLEGMEALWHLRRGAVQLDVHSLTLDFAPNGKRFLSKPEGWQRWVACADWVQMNETEARLLGEGLPLQEFADSVLALGPQGVFVTLGSAGCHGFWREGSERRSLRLPAARQPEPAFPTGCGDVFGAGFAYARLQGAPVAAALHFANTTAGTKAGWEPYGALRDLRQALAPELAALGPETQA